ncbi:MAG: hypothetical protein V7L22_04115, partial [Nostoc sp.]|uniref:hypothetical protein n=1 Tax=Nostoc sp. TaxID=1180 RepID=UPI002FFBAE6F
TPICPKNRRLIFTQKICLLYLLPFFSSVELTLNESNRPRLPFTIVNSSHDGISLTQKYVLAVYTLVFFGKYLTK